MPRLAQMAAVVLLTAVAAPAFGQEVQLQWKFKEGDKFYVEDVTAMKQSVAVVGQVIQHAQSLRRLRVRQQFAQHQMLRPHFFVRNAARFDYNQALVPRNSAGIPKPAVLVLLKEGGVDVPYNRYLADVVVEMEKTQTQAGTTRMIAFMNQGGRIGYPSNA